MNNALKLDAASAVAMDTRGLAGLRQQAKTAPDTALRAAAGQFEALFMQMLLKSMRDALPQDGPFASETTKTYTAMFDQQMAQVLARKGVGIADLLVKQLSGRTGTESGGVGIAAPAKASPGGAAVGAAAAPAPAPAAPRLAATPAGGATGALSPTMPAPPGGLPESARGFIEKMRPHAEAAAQAAGIPVAFLLAQAALETGWGRHQPRAADGAASHNLFGIKAGASWQGGKALAATTEYVAGKATTALESFRAYASYAESFQDFARLMRGSARYAGVLTATGDGSAYAQRLQQAGYATDPRYAEKLTRIIEAVGRYAARGPAQVVLERADNRSGTG
jgi:flagellar protein FlgJ